MNIPDTSEVISKLKELIHSRGYIYALCMILYEDFHLNLDQIHKVNYREKLSVKECALILGFLVKDKINLSYPNAPDDLIHYKEKTYELMKELHYSFNSTQFNELHSLMNKESHGEDNTDVMPQNFFAKNGGMVEPMFYAGDGVYDFQYLEFLERKYKYDKEWLLKNKSFEIESVIRIVKEIKEISQEKSKQIRHFELKQRFPEIVEKLNKKLRKHYSKSKLELLAKEQLTVATFYQYSNLFRMKKDKKEADEEDWHFFYNNLLELFIVKESDFINKDDFRNFINNFSFFPDGKINEEYLGTGYFNVLNEKPIIEIKTGNYFVPINYLVAEAVYESPFYWLFDDKSYKDIAAENRGKVGEEIAYEFLSKVFGESNTFKSVLIQSKKGAPDTDIDVLCVLGNKALCVQVKSKKVTLNAKKGEFEQLKKDFKGAIQDAFDQGLLSRACILSKSVKIFDNSGNELLLNEEIDEVYVMSLTTENHPSLVHQLRVLLDKSSDDPYPIALTVFDLELLVHYLPDPYDFLYYIRQRIDLMEYFLADEEFCYLGYHLINKLCKNETYDSGVIDNDFGGLIDRNYYPYKAGLSEFVSTKNDPILNRWKDPNFDQLANIIKNSKHTKSVDIIFNLLDWSGESRQDIVRHIIRTKKESKATNNDKSLATSTTPIFGLSYQVFKNFDFHEVEDKVSCYSILKKYQLKCNSWLGIGSFANSPNLIDFLSYYDDPWEYDNELELACNDFFINKPGHIITQNNKQPPSRNDRCPCNSGLKYKKCCWNKRKVF